MKYSFVLPAYKARFLKEAIDSILSQTYKEFELIVVNDASPEDLDSIVKSYDDFRIHYYVNDENIGGVDLVAQWNHCLGYATGDYIILASDDDVYHPEYLEKMNVLVDKYPDANVFRPRIQKINEKGEIFAIDGFLKEHTSILEFVYAWTNGNIKSGIPYYLFKKNALISIGGFINFPLAWFSDDATVIKLSGKGIVFCPEILFSFRDSGENISTKPNDRLALKSKIEATTRFYYLFEEIIKKIIVNSDIENFYKKYVLNCINNCLIGHLNYLIEVSELGAVLYNWRTLRRYLSLRCMIHFLLKKVKSLLLKK